MGIATNQSSFCSVQGTEMDRLCCLGRACDFGCPFFTVGGGEILGVLRFAYTLPNLN